AGSSNQTLIVKWTVSVSHASAGNVTLQAAALSANGVDNPPFAILTSPVNNATFTAPTNIALSASAMDPDGTVSKVEYFQSGTKLGESTDAAGQFPLTWSNAAPGNYVVTARVTDNGGAFSISSPISVFVNANGGMLTGRVDFPPAAVDLTAEGTADWAHWGLISPDSFDHKIGVPRQISNFTMIGTNALHNFGDDFTTYSWTNGTPDLSANSSTGVFIYGLANGFQLTVPADTHHRTLKVYAGAFASVGNFQAFLSDFSAPAFTDTSVSNFSGNAYAIFTLNYSAASPGQALTVRYSSLAEFDQQFGNVTLQSATLQGQPPLVLLSPAPAGNGFSFNFATQAGQTYTVQYTTSLASPITWQTLTNFTGDGTVAAVTDANPSVSARFYRVQVQ
ncbi:MAG TPA: Ig-like domain-containing protein, partial [Verrucomicrobiae bacterium]|nr:Ig-like domain-containing protein [Verrucomicrobiae bacterium]